MSNNKYIIDEDSLTGIADAVRDKLGNGEAITDEDAGYYPASVKKLGYSQAADSAGYSGPGSGYTSSNTIYARPVLELENICGIRPSYIKVTVTPSAAFNSNDIIYRFTNQGSPSSSRVDSAGFSNYVAILSIPNDIENCYIEYGGYYSSYSSQYLNRSIPAYDVVFLDSNQNEININEYFGNSFAIDQWGTTKTFLTGTSFEKIPFSIDDIQDKITNYLGQSSSLIYRYHINPQSNENGTSFLGTPLSEMNVLDYGVTSVSQIKFMLIYGYNTSSSFTWYPSSSMSYTMIINGKPFYAADSGNVYWPNWTSDNRYSSYKLQLCPSKLSSWPLGIMRGTTSSYMGEDSLQYPKIVFMILDLEATE